MLVTYFLYVSLTLVVTASDQNGSNFQGTHLDDIIKILNGLEPSLDVVHLLGRLTVHKNDIKFSLYNSNNSQGLYVGEEDLHNFNPETEIKIIVHGWGENARRDWYKSMTNEYLKKGDYNVIQVDWEKPALYDYVISSMISKEVGDIIGQLIVDINENQKVSLENFHIIGHSLGAHVAGFAGKEVQKQIGNKIGRITGLDPAGPYFERPPRFPAERLSNNDAKVVDVIHTDGEIFGSNKPIGTIDFYVNGGVRPQPGCSAAFLTIPINLESLVPIVFCSHIKSYLYFIESINSKNYQASKCDSWKSYEEGHCEQNEKATFGENLETGKMGIFYLSTDY